MNQSEFLAFTCNLFKVREKSLIMQGAIGFGFASHWLKNWHEILKPITKCSNCKRVSTFDCHLKAAQIILIIKAPSVHLVVLDTSLKVSIACLFKL